ncbi:MAG TPA: SDR family NAD(P)-dependent oxidoreductase [Acidimicrobiales bacterium]|nr:SDR family NAD(P)-dependent oxidoreductase [Acidimicrobiales bacterium]
MAALQGKVAVVTGGASGIGLASARLLASEGATVVVVDANGDGAEKAAAALGGIAVRADVGNVGDWAAIVGAARHLGGLDIAYLNAGVTTGEEDITKLTDEQYRRIMSVNVDGIVFGTRAVVPELVARGGGSVVATSSLAGIVSFPGDPIYTLTKHAVVGFVRSVAARLAEQHITINAICPGLVDTPLIDGEIRDVLAESGFPLISAESVAEAVLGCVLGEQTGQAVVVQLGREPVAYRFGRPPGPRASGVEGKIPPGWLAAQDGGASSPAGD